VTYIIAEPCIDIKDLSCVDVCPVDCIHEFERILIIDPEECIDCGACEPECPVEAIFPEDALPDKWEPFVKINYAFGEGADVIEPSTRSAPAAVRPRSRLGPRGGTCPRAAAAACAPPRTGLEAAPRSSSTTRPSA
jgi:ferredoxin